MPDVVIVDGVRTPIGRAFKGSLKDVRADDLAAIAPRELLKRVPELDPADISDVMMGYGFPHGEASYNIARNASYLAGIPFSVPACTVNRFCSSSLQTIRMAFHAIKAGEGHTYLAAGAEAVSRQVTGGLQLPLNDDVKHPKLQGGDDAICDAYISMGLTAENVAEQCNVSREAQDEWAVKSQSRAVAAQEAGVFDREIVPVTTPDGTVVTKDDGPRPGTTVEKLATLKPAFKPDGGTVTAGNACPLNDGSAACLVMSADRAKELGLNPRVKIIASSVGALRPEIMGLGPLEAVKRVLAQAKMKISDIDVIELNEAFAAQVVPCKDEWGLTDETDGKLNPHGGAIALGHPFGMTGARIMTTLMNDLETMDATYGLETMCVAGGQGMAMIVERID